MKRNSFGLILLFSLILTGVFGITAYAATTTDLVNDLVAGTVTAGGAYDGQLIISSTLLTDATNGIINVGDINASYINAGKITIPAITIKATNDITNHTMFDDTIRGITASVDSPLVLDDVTGITLDGVTVDCSAQTSINTSVLPGKVPMFAGIFVNKGSGNTISGVTVNGIQRGADVNGNSSFGIIGFATSTLTIEGSTVQATTGAIPYFKTGIIITDTGTGTEVKGNTVNGIPNTMFGAQNGILVYTGATGVKVDGNFVNNIGYGGSNWSASGVITLEASTEITNNTFSGFVGDYAYIAALVDVPKVEGNTIVTVGTEISKKEISVPFISVVPPTTTTFTVLTDEKVDLKCDGLMTPKQPTIKATTWTSSDLVNTTVTPSTTDPLEATFVATSDTGSPYTVTLDIDSVDRAQADKTHSGVATYNITVVAGAKITFDAKGVVPDPTPIIVKVGDAISGATQISPAGTVALPYLSKPGYTFLGWNDAADGKGAMITTTTVLSADITAYAMWSVNSTTVPVLPPPPVPKEEIVLHPANPASTTNTQTVSVGVAVASMPVAAPKDETTKALASQTSVNESTRQPITTKSDGKTLQGIVTKQDTKVYTKPNATSKVVTTVSKNQPLIAVGAPVKLKGSDVLWRRVLINGEVGYVQVKALKLAKPNTTKSSYVYIYNDAKLAEVGKSTNIVDKEGNVVGKLDKNVMIAVVDETATQYKIVFGSGFAYIPKTAAKLIDMSEFNLA